MAACMVIYLLLHALQIFCRQLDGSIVEFLFPSPDSSNSPLHCRIINFCALYLESNPAPAFVGQELHKDGSALQGRLFPCEFRSAPYDFEFRNVNPAL